MTNRTHRIIYFLTLILSFSLSLITPTLLESQGVSQTNDQVHYENQLIEKVEFNLEGTCQGSFDSAILLSRMKTRPGEFFSINDFDNDLKDLSIQYDKVLPDVESIDGKLFISIKLWQRPVIRAIWWKGNQALTMKELKEELKICQPSVFDRPEFNKSFQKLRAYYVKKGYFEAELNYTVKLDEECNEVDIYIEICEGRAGWIRKIVFENFCRDEEDDLVDMILTKEYIPLLSLLNGTGVYHEDVVQQDKLMVLNYLQNKGYADAQVELDIVQNKKNDRITVILRANRGELYTISKVSFTGNELFEDERIRVLFTFAPGSPFSPDELRETERRITNLYGRYGYIDAFASIDVSLDEGCNTYSIRLEIEEGKQHRVGLIKVLGNCITQTNVILHETLLIPGEVFNLEKLQKTQERLNNIGYFKSVNVYNVKSEGLLGVGDCYRDVHIEVEEAQTGHFGLFFGFSSVESIFGGVNVTERNFNSAGLFDIWDHGTDNLRGRGEYLHLSSTIGKLNRKYELDWTKPYFMDTPWSIGFEVDNSCNRMISDDYDINTWGFNLHTWYQVNAYVRTGWHYRLRHSTVDVPGCMHGNPSLKAIHDSAGTISAVGVNWDYDSTNSPICPTGGIKSRLEAEFAGVGGTQTFFALGYTNTYYKEIFKHHIFKLRADIKFIVPVGGTTSNDIPIDERLFLGGDYNVRGFRNYRIGPLYADYHEVRKSKKEIDKEDEERKAQGKKKKKRSSCDHITGWKFHSKNGDPKGGISLQFFSGEYKFRVTKRIDGFLFCDVGHLSSGNFDFWGRFYVAPGFGACVRVMDSIPPITLGMGFPVNAKDRSQVKRFFIQFGAKF